MIRSTLPVIVAAALFSLGNGAFAQPSRNAPANVGRSRILRLAEVQKGGGFPAELTARTKVDI